MSVYQYLFFIQSSAGDPCLCMPIPILIHLHWLPLLVGSLDIHPLYRIQYYFFATVSTEGIYHMACEYTAAEISTRFEHRTEISSLILFLFEKHFTRISDLLLYLPSDYVDILIFRYHHRVTVTWFLAFANSLSPVSRVKHFIGLGYGLLIFTLSPTIIKTVEELTTRCFQGELKVNVLLKRNFLRLNVEDVHLLL